MTQYTDLELSNLVDMLSEETNRFCDMRADGSPDEEEFAHCWRKIILLQEAIKNKYDTAKNKIDPSLFYLKKLLLLKKTGTNDDKR